MTTEARTNEFGFMAGDLVEQVDNDDLICPGEVLEVIDPGDRWGMRVRMQSSGEEHTVRPRAYRKVTR